MVVRRIYCKHQLSCITGTKELGKDTCNATHRFSVVHLVLALHRVDFLASSHDAQSHLRAGTRKTESQNI